MFATAIAKNTLYVVELPICEILIRRENDSQMGNWQIVKNIWLTNFVKFGFSNEKKTLCGIRNVNAHEWQNLKNWRIYNY